MKSIFALFMMVFAIQAFASEEAGSRPANDQTAFVPDTYDACLANGTITRLQLLS